MNPKRSTARVRREELKADLSRTLARAAVDHDVDMTAVAEACGVAHSLAHRWTDKSTAQVAGLVETVLLGDEAPGVSRTLLTWAAEKIGLRVVEAATVARESLLTALGASVKETGEAHAAVLAGLADGVWDDAELRRAISEANEAERAIVSIKEALTDELARRAAPAPRAKA